MAQAPVPPPVPKGSHGNDNRGLAAGAIPGVAFGRYGPMFDGLKPANRLPPGALWALAEAMIKVDAGAPIDGTDPADENPTISAGYTYFGQFVDHDLTLDPTPFNTSERDRSALVDFRSPALDLDNIYGRGPDDQPYMYNSDGLTLVMGQARTNGGAVTGTRRDLFRVTAGDRTDVPVIGDKRNDENKIVSQMHGAMIEFHNKVVKSDSLIQQFGGDPADATSRFKAAANIVRWHYQWVVVFDYLEQICEPGMVDEVLNPRGTPHLNNYMKADAAYPYMPVEFAGAAFRFGHSMIRPSYALNRAVGTDTVGVGGAEANRIPTFNRDPDRTKNLNGFPGPLAPDWGIDWGFFFKTPTADLVAAQKAGSGKAFNVPQPSYRIDALLVAPLADLPEFFKTTDPKELVDQIGADKIKPPPGTTAQQTLVGHLAFRNLLRGQKLGLPSGQDVACHLGIEPLSDDVLWSAGSRLLKSGPKLGADDQKSLDATTAARQSVLRDWGHAGLRRSAPLWYYILREAEYYGVTHDPHEKLVAMGGQHLGPVGSRIVAETLIGVLWCDKTSFLHDFRGFKPLKEIAGAGPLTIASLLAYALK